MGFIFWPIDAPVKITGVSIVVAPVQVPGRKTVRQATLVKGSLELLDAPAEEVGEDARQGIGVVIPVPTSLKLHVDMSLSDKDAAEAVCYAALTSFPGTKRKIFEEEEEEEEEEAEEDADADMADDQSGLGVGARVSGVLKTPTPPPPADPVRLDVRKCASLDKVLQAVPHCPDVAVEALCGTYASDYEYLVFTWPSTMPIACHGTKTLTFCVGYTHDLLSHSLLVPSCSMIDPEMVDEELEWFDHRIYSVHTDRADAAKNSAEMLKNMKMRFASGSMMDIVPPSSSLQDVVNAFGDAGLLVAGSAEDDRHFRLKRIVGTHPHHDLTMRVTSLKKS